MFHSAEQENRIQAEQTILRSGEARDVSLCQYKLLSCVRCCLPHIGGDSYMQGPDRYLGPGGIVVQFKNYNPLQDPKIAVSQYEDSFPDAGREEMERRFLERRKMFLSIYDPARPGQSLPEYIKAAQRNEGYRYTPEASSGPVSMFSGGAVSRHLQKGELPECHLLGYVDEKGRAGCMAHPLAATSRGYDGRDQVGFFAHTGCCGSVECEASKEFRFLSPGAMKVFEKAVNGMSWYEYSRHATSVLVYYLRSYDHVLQLLEERSLLDRVVPGLLVDFTNTLFDRWPLKEPDSTGDPDCMNPLEILTADIPLAERIFYIALGTRFARDRFDRQLRHARDHLKRHIETLR